MIIAGLSSRINLKDSVSGNYDSKSINIKNLVDEQTFAGLIILQTWLNDAA